MDDEKKVIGDQNKSIELVYVKPMWYPLIYDWKS